jgi:heme-degrading monooxygenase HmoA
MIAVIFEVEPAPDRRQDYLDAAAALRPELEAIDGFVSIERFASLARPGKILSLSFWRDEEAVKRWRTLPAHRAMQTAGRAGIFRDYRLRVAAIVRDYGMFDRDQVPDYQSLISGSTS